MKFALIDGHLREAAPDLTGLCPWCGSPMRAKCGSVRIWHWAHEGTEPRHCDRWWENETEWHRNWKARFPDRWQECRCTDGAVWHVADVRTAQGWVLELQHSRITAKERASREAFYPKLIWVVDAAAQHQLKGRFLKAYQRWTAVDPDSGIAQLPSEGTLLRTWVLSRTHVFFDFGDGEQLWWLAPVSDRLWAYVRPVPLDSFVGTHRVTEGDDESAFDRAADRLERRVGHFRRQARPSVLSPKRKRGSQV